MPRTGQISRRAMIAGPAASLAIAPRAFAQAPAAPRIEKFAPELDAILSTDQPVKELGNTFGGPLGPAEGPVWIKEGGHLLFSDIHNSRIMKYTPGQGMSVFRDPSNRANGLTRDLQGRLVVAEHDSRRVTRTEPDGSQTVILNNWQGKRLNRPNDVVVKSDGSIYITDPWTWVNPPEMWDLNMIGVYRVSPDLGTVSLLASDFLFPNGICFSPDEKLVYINDTRRMHIRSFELLPNGTLSTGTGKVFADLSGGGPGAPDGMKVDVAGNVYCGGAGGLYILSPEGKKLGRVVHGQTMTSNCCFGGDDWKTLFFTTRNTLGSVQLKIAGLPVPAAGKKPGVP